MHQESLKDEDQIKIKTISEYLFFDQFHILHSPIPNPQSPIPNPLIIFHF